MSNFFSNGPRWAVGIGAAVVAVAVPLVLTVPEGGQSKTPQGQVDPATPVSVAQVEQRNVGIWSEFSGRLEAVERVEVRSRVAGSIEAVHFREGALVKQGDLLITIDPSPYAAEVDRATAQVLGAQARVVLTKSENERSQQLVHSGTGAISQTVADQRYSAFREAEAALKAAEAALQTAKLNLSYTSVRAPVSGRVGKLEITVGNIVAAGPGAPVLTTLVSVDPIYASFNADEDVVVRARKGLTTDDNGYISVENIPVQMVISANGSEAHDGRLNLIDNQVDARSGTIRVRAVFDNADGDLIPGQFARVRMGQPKTESALVISERAVGTDQNKKFVLVVDGQNRAEYREVGLGASVDGLRVVTSGLKPGERIVVNGLQRIRPGALIAPQMVGMDGKAVQAQASPPATEVVQR